MFTDMECCYIARLVKYDKESHLADIQPLTKMSEGMDSAQYLDIPVTENCYMMDEMLDELKSEFSKVDTNTSLPEHESTSFVSKFPKKRLLRVGVPVVCAVLDRDNDNWKGGRDATTFMPNTNRTHDANDSVVIGVLGGDWVNG
ncbi:hypothetical protein [Lactobacillus crispatus]|uniref:hypothetical protein n=2 Tax=Lactobacillaceae TaxID=33958 RepID=UPI00215104DB|nr:hypothetical protein [Lactobacillus crispatus]